MISWFLIITGNLLFWATIYYAKEHNIDLKFTNPNKYTLLESIAQIGFWLTFIGIAILIWG
jgi:hypothetical protein